jgi:uncharacterized LabA/DUF88 family protein
MRVALLIDGQNFYTGWKERTGGRHIDFPLLAGWLVEQVGGTTLTGVDYYTGVERGERADQEGQQKLAGYLDMLDRQTGWFVHRFPRVERIDACSTCHTETAYTTEKAVDTSIVADMVMGAAADRFDVAVLLSGDADLAPGVAAVRRLGKRCWLATFEGYGLAGALRREAWDHLDLSTGLDTFSSTEEPRPSQQPTEDTHTAFLNDLQRAERHFASGYVGLNYFLTRWSSDTLPTRPDDRRAILDELLRSGAVEDYATPSGDRALRVQAPGVPNPDGG